MPVLMGENAIDNERTRQIDPHNGDNDRTPKK